MLRSFSFFFDIRDSISDCADFLSVIIGNFHVEFIFQFHYELNDIQRVSAEIITERSFRFHFALVNPQTVNNNLRHAIQYCRQYNSPPFKAIKRRRAGRGDRRWRN